MLKTSKAKSKPQKITYSDYKNLDFVRFNGKFRYVLDKEKITPCTKFYESSNLTSLYFKKRRGDSLTLIRGGLFKGSFFWGRFLAFQINI